MMRSFLAVAIIVVSFIGLPSCSVTSKNANSYIQENIVGDWQSILLEGKDIGDFLKSIDFSFKSKSEFSVTATMVDGTKETKTGDYFIKNNRITMTIQGESKSPTFKLENGLLTIDDPELDSHVTLKKK